MPTPSDYTIQLPSITDLLSLPHTTCPPDLERSDHTQTPQSHQVHEDDEDVQDDIGPRHALSRPHTDTLGAMDDIGSEVSGNKTMETDQEQTVEAGQSPMSVSMDVKDSEHSAPTASSSMAHSMSSSTDDNYSRIRLLPNHTSSFLHAGSKFRGTQQSDRQVYKVEVDIKHVDMAESFLCGYLRIEGLTEDHPSLTTYFEGEIIGPKYTFRTTHPSWGATDKTDMQHWARFPAWKPLAKQAKKPDFHYKNCAQRENIFMRWKEYFLVPDHRVREIMGASFEGFYYICFNQVAGTVSGIYFHSKSEKFQQLELTHVNDKGCLGAIEFR